LGLAFALVLVKTGAVVDAVEKWESRAFGEISKGAWKEGKSWFCFSTLSMDPAFP
jgi:hypothetical protein